MKEDTKALIDKANKKRDECIAAIKADNAYWAGYPYPEGTNSQAPLLGEYLAAYYAAYDTAAAAVIADAGLAPRNTYTQLSKEAAE